MKKYNYDEIFNNTLKYFNGDELATNVWINKYCLKDSDGNYYEKSPDNMHHRLAQEIYRIEQKYNIGITEEEIYNLLKDFKYLIPGGSSMSGIGNDLQITSLSNCFVIGNEHDSYGGIIQLDEEQVQLMKRRGGVGLDLSHIRPKGSPVKNSALTSTGVVPFMERYSNTTKEVAQDGRRGALMLSLSINHPDVESFIDAKLEQGKVTGANISVKITDDFMKHVIEDKSFIQSYPINNDKKQYTNEIDAKRLWNKIIHNAWKSAEPGILFWGNIINSSIPDCYSSFGFKSTSTNPCGEIPLCPYESCRLMSLNLYSYVENPFTKYARFNFELFGKHAQLAIRIMDNIIDLELEKIEKIINKIKLDIEPDSIKNVELELWNKIKEKTIQGRRAGIGITAEGDMLAAMGYIYGSEESIQFSEQVHKCMLKNIYIGSIKLAQERNSFPIWNHELEKDNQIIQRIIYNETFPIEYKQLYEQYGRRNIACTTIAPNGSISILTQTTSGIEPAFGIRYNRKRKVNPNDKTDNKQIEYDAEGIKWEKYVVYHHKFIDWAKINNISLDNLTDEEFNDIYKQSPYYNSTSKDIDWVAKVKLQGTVQKYIEHSISATTNIPENTSEEIVSQIYMTAWESGCKGMTIYREGSRDGVLTAKTSNNQFDINTVIEINAPKRPKILEADVIFFNNKGEKWVGILGLLNGRPYEIFTGKLEAFNIPTFVNKGNVIKVKENGNSRYDFQYTDGDGYKITMEGLNRAFNREYWNYGRLISGILRHGMPLKNVYDIVDTLKLDGNDTFDWKSGVRRLIKKYISDGTKTKEKCPNCGADIIFSGGCKRCSSCSWEYCEA